MLDPFQQFADGCGLRLTAECLSVAPRDVLSPLDRADQHYLVSLSRPEVDAAPARQIFIVPLTQAALPSIRDVLWWMASDAWIVEQSQRELEPWAASFGYPVDEEPTARLFEHHCHDADVLAALLGEMNYRHLLSIYDGEISELHTEDRDLRM